MTELLTTFHQAPQAVVSAIKAASQKSGVDFSYLMQQAKAESSFDITAQASSSSATGLFQFIDSTWETLMQRYGAELGIAPDAHSREERLGLRKDPELSAHMAAKLATENSAYLKREWGGEVDGTALYFSHFLGAQQSAAFLNARDQTPSAPAADLFPKAAHANRPVFFHADGRSKTLEEVHATFAEKFTAQGQAATISPSRSATSLNPQPYRLVPIDQGSVFNARRPPPSTLSPRLLLNPWDLIRLTQGV